MSSLFNRILAVCLVLRIAEYAFLGFLMIALATYLRQRSSMWFYICLGTHLLGSAAVTVLLQMGYSEYRIVLTITTTAVTATALWMLWERGNGKTDGN